MPHEIETWEELSRQPQWARSIPYRFVLNGRRFVVRVTQRERRKGQAHVAAACRATILQACREEWGEGRLIHLGGNEFRYLAGDSADLPRLVTG